MSAISAIGLVRASRKYENNKCKKHLGTMELKLRKRKIVCIVIILRFIFEIKQIKYSKIIAFSQNATSKF
ncbi:hypothetical protein BpHYR1_004305 [Brachionus plicatilis]|uniref:Uncharacterized protein n=1 Tax=Brachionus plicatilis TaxID=10195 RepID=A0A3M7QSL6_BRAPC|nr:hypothetical protein BpHYR1_004305 [Brachionus plicatilis]